MIAILEGKPLDRDTVVATLRTLALVANHIAQGMEDASFDITRAPIFLSQCLQCPSCGEAICPQCGGEYGDCECPGPHSEIG